MSVLATGTAAAAVATELNAHPEVHVHLDGSGDALVLEDLVVPAGGRRNGVGTTVLAALCAAADDYGLDVLVRPDDCYGTPRPVLVGFYARAGFLLDRDRRGWMRRPAQG